MLPHSRNFIPVMIIIPQNTLFIVNLNIIKINFYECNLILTNKICLIIGKINEMNANMAILYNIWMEQLQCRTNHQIACVEASNCFCRNICGINVSDQKYKAIRLLHQLQSKYIWYNMIGYLYLQQYKHAVKVFLEMALIQCMWLERVT